MIENILENNEKIIWRWKQDLKSVMIWSIFIFVLLVWISYLIWNSDWWSCTINWHPWTPEECKNVTNLFSYIALWIWFVIPLFSYISYLVTEYALTSKRLIIKWWLIWADIRSINFEQVRSIFVNVWLLWRILWTWTILIDTWRITQTKNGSRTDYDKFYSIDTPYDVYKKIQETMSDYKEANSSWRSDFENNRNEYKEFIQETEKFKKEI